MQFKRLADLELLDDSVLLAAGGFYVAALATRKAR